MPNQTSKLVQDSSLSVAAFALPNAASTTVTSAVLDIGSNPWISPQFDFLLTVPALTTTMVPNADLYTFVIESSTTSVFTAVDATIFSRTIAGAGGVGIAAQTAITCRAPSNCAQYVRAKIISGASTTDASTLSANFGIRF